MNYAKTFENGSLPPIHLSITTPHAMPTTKVLHCGASKATPSLVGKRLVPCCGFTESVHIPLPSESLFPPLMTTWCRSWLWEEYSQVRYSPTSCVRSNFILLTSSVIIRDIKSMSNAGSASLAYFYFDFKDTAKQDSRALLSSLLLQLSDQSLDQSDIYCDALFSLYSAHKRGSEQPTSDSLWQCLKYMLTTAGQVPIYLVLDALDECPNGSGLPSPREKLLDLVDELVKLRHPTLRLCITSRPEFDICVALEPLATQQVSLHDESGQAQDIIDYVINVVRSDRRMKRWRDDEKDMVIEKLAEKADGM